MDKKNLLHWGLTLQVRHGKIFTVERRAEEMAGQKTWVPKDRTRRVDMLDRKRQRPEEFKILEGLEKGDINAILLYRKILKEV